MNSTAMLWQRSSFCNAGLCVEVARSGGAILMRDGKNPGQDPIVFTPAEWDDFQDRLIGRFRGDS